MAVEIGIGPGPAIPATEAGFGASVLLALRGGIEDAELVGVLEVGEFEALVGQGRVFLVCKEKSSF